MSAESENDKKQKLWYIRRSGKIKGPFPSGTLRRFILLGRVKPTDQVSQDKKSWYAVMGVPEVVPPKVREAAAEGHMDDRRDQSGDHHHVGWRAHRLSAASGCQRPGMIGRFHCLSQCHGSVIFECLQTSVDEVLSRSSDRES